MRSFTTLSIAAMLAAGSVAGAMAQTTIASALPSIYVYNFNDAGVSGTNSAANTAILFAVDKSPTGTAAGSVLSTNFAAANIVDFAGTAVNGDNSDASGLALALQGGAASTSTPISYANNGDYLQATANLVGYKAINVSFANQATATGFNSDQFQYSVDGINFINFGAVYAPVLSTAGATGSLGFASASNPGAVESFNLSGISALNNDPTAAFRIVFNGATSAAGNDRLDNFIIAGTVAPAAAVPEASTTVSFGLLLALGGFAVAKKRVVRIS